MLEKQVACSLSGSDYYSTLENHSIALQNRVSLIIKHLEFSQSTSISTLIKALDYFQKKEGHTGKESPCEFLEENEIKFLQDEKGKWRPSLYKVLLFMKVADAIKAGELNLLHSYRYLSIDDYLISKIVWQNNREDYILRAGIGHLTQFESIIIALKNALNAQYEKTNDNVLNGKNRYLTFNKLGELILETPKVEKAEIQKISELLPKNQYISILDVLRTLDEITGFSQCFQHYKIKENKARPIPSLFYAGIMGKGCNIGINKLSNVSKGINENTLETVINWYFSHDTILAANNRIVSYMNKLTLPNLLKKSKNKLHTSSDGQKRNVNAESIISNFSFKYHGSGQGVSIYDFIDERHILFHSLVMSSSEREAAYVIDGLICNEEIKSDIHSTDTHGYTETIFAITHLLGISFAPRIAKLKKRNLYSFESKKTYQNKNYKILPDGYIDIKLIQENWEDILRLMATIKLKETTASQIFKRLSSYSKQNPLYKAIKEFGKIIKTQFLLTYMDNLDLRQAIQKQLNKIELANKFSDAVFFDNNQEFKQGTKEEQEIAMACKILIQNAIVLWNYLYLSQLLATTSSKEKQQAILNIIHNGSVMTWRHINLLGEYDFTERTASNSPSFNIAKILAWKG